MSEKCNGCRKKILNGERCITINHAIMGMLSEGKIRYYHVGCVGIYR